MELEVSRHLRRNALGIEGKGQLIVAAFAVAEASLCSPWRDSKRRAAGVIRSVVAEASLRIRWRDSKRRVSSNSPTIRSVSVINLQLTFLLFLSNPFCINDFLVRLCRGKRIE